MSLHLTQNILPVPKQSGFKVARSTETSIVAITEKLHVSRSVLVLLHLSAAFNSINHRIFLTDRTVRSVSVISLSKYCVVLRGTNSAFGWFCFGCAFDSVLVLSPPCPVAGMLPDCVHLFRVTLLISLSVYDLLCLCLIVKSAKWTCRVQVDVTLGELKTELERCRAVILNV